MELDLDFVQCLLLLKHLVRIRFPTCSNIFVDQLQCISGLSCVKPGNVEVSLQIPSYVVHGMSVTYTTFELTATFYSDTVRTRQTHKQ